MMVEDHPFDYRHFEGIIPEGEYGGGTVIVWDEGTYEPIEPVKGKKAQEKHLLAQLKSGSVKIILHGRKLQGEFALVKTHGMGENAWLLIKHKDEYSSVKDITKQGQSAIVATQGNDDCHVILRGGKQPNYDRSSVEAAIGSSCR